MKKADLRTGMIVETANGRFGKVMLNTKAGNIIAGENNRPDTERWCLFTAYNEALEDVDGDTEYDIVRVYDFVGNGTAASISTRGDIIWERTEPTPEYTMEELTEIIGHTFKIKK